MTLGELLLSINTWAAAHSLYVLVAGVGIPVVGTIAARIGKGGRTDHDGKVIASAVLGVAILGVILEVLYIIALRSLVGRGVADVDALLLFAPIACVAGSVIGIRWVFPLNELGSYRTFGDVSAFVLTCLSMVWLFSHFRWGIIFFGTFSQLAIVAAAGIFLLRRLYLRAFVRPREANAP